MIPRHLLFLTLLLALFAALVLAQKSPSPAQTAKDNGAYLITLETPRGKIKVYLPDDMAAGDTISGTVITEPSGSSEPERQRNSAELSGYVVELQNQKAPLSGGVIQRVSLAHSGGAANLILLDAKGKQIGLAPIPLASATQTPRSTGFNLPPLGQTSRAVQIQGPFDGDSANTSVKIGGIDAKVLAESPRKVVVESPPNVIGPTEIAVNENGNAATGSFRNLKIDLTAPKTSLLKGESTELHMQVRGLEELSEPVNVELQNQTPSSVNVAGGNTQNIVIAPAQVQSGGTFPWVTEMTGTGSGHFNITAGVTTPPPAPPSQPVASVPSPSPSPVTATPVSTSPTQTPATTASNPSPAAGQISGPQVLPVPSPADNFDGTFTKAATDCCKKFLDNGMVSFMDGQGNGFKLDKNALIVFIDGKRYEWLFTQDGQPFPIAWMFCHLNDHQIISQLTNVMVQRVAGGNTNERSNTTSVSLAGPYRDQKDRRPFYGFQFGAQKFGTDVKEYSVGFSMDEATCTWTWRIFAEGKVHEFTTQTGPLPTP